MTEVDQSWISQSKWIWTPHYSDEVDPEKTIAKVVLFRKTFELETGPSHASILHISADTRYSLYVNESKVCFGPCKSFLAKWNYESVDISPFLKKGKNVIAVRVLRIPFAQSGPVNMVKASVPGFILHWKLSGDFTITTDDSWSSLVDNSISIKSTEAFPSGGPFLPIYQNVIADKQLVRWNCLDFDDSDWPKAVFVRINFPQEAPWRLSPRSIPLLTHIEKRFEKISKLQYFGDYRSKIEDFEPFLKDSDVIIPAHTEISLDLDAGGLTTGFPLLELAGGARSKIDILYSECYERLPPTGAPPFGAPRLKGDRTDTNGVLVGGVDNYKVAGCGEFYEPIWIRTFRFIQLTIRTQDTPLVLKSYKYFDVHYPLEDKTAIKLESPETQNLWNISRRTLRYCMHETYEDCPYYEQSQFVMDSRSQLLFTYQLCRDDRLARKTIHEFFSSIGDDGLVQTFFPSAANFKQIPQFSLYWVLMLYDHMIYFGDKSLLRSYLGGVDTVLSAFDSKLNDFEMIGRFSQTGWPFVDWVKEWVRPPTAFAFPPVYAKNGTITYTSLLCSYVLQKAADIATFLSRHDTASEYLSRAKALNDAVNKHTFDGEYYTDGPETTDKCQHTQVFAVLSGAIKGKEASELLKKTFDKGNTFPKCSYAFGFYVFRAFEAAKIYEENLDTLLSPWKKMIKDNLSTWAEDDVNQRSDCHGWSASPIYEICTQVFGVYPSGPGSPKLVVAPKTNLAIFGRGSFVTKFGNLDVRIKPGNKILVSVKADAAMPIEFRIDGITKALDLKANEVEEFAI